MSLKDWFGKGKKGDWVRVGTDGKIKGDCAREPGEGKPKCMPRSKAHSMSKKDRATSAMRKRRKDPCLLYTSPSPRDRTRSRMPSSA